MSCHIMSYHDVDSELCALRRARLRALLEKEHES